MVSHELFRWGDVKQYFSPKLKQVSDINVTSRFTNLEPIQDQLYVNECDDNFKIETEMFIRV